MDIRREPAAHTRAPQAVAATAYPAAYPSAYAPAASRTSEAESPSSWSSPAVNGSRASLDLADDLDVPDFLK